MATIARDGEQVSLGETQVAEGSAAFELVPFLQAWGIPIPQSRMDTVGKVMAAAKKGD